ncbi:SWIM zinc finger family protein [Spirosoma spitsbergense]|uniref:SWIM zinc finger family protein n=1 Tax=Spirosoma spitsbergense TaxID=431554 RepID=UPI00037760B1|nr:hypothetical protein [Spirosoma spitsbergense]
MLTKTILQQLANPSSYSKGESYFRNSYVRRIKRSGNTFTGNVEGSELYSVSLTIGGVEPDFSCDCPYNFEGICKHSVAFGLAVIDQFGPVIDLVDAIPSIETPVVDLNTLWQEISDDQKLDFLHQLLDKQPDLRAQFAQFAVMESSTPTLVFFTQADNVSSVEGIGNDVFAALSNLRFDDDGLEMEVEDYYSEESPDPDPLIESVLTEYADDVIKALREGRLTDAMTSYMGVYEGTQAASEPEYDEYGSIDDYPSQTWDVWHGLLAEAYTQLASRVLHPDQISQALSQLAERVTFFDENEEDEEDYDEEDDYDEQEPAQIYYNLKSFEPLLLALVTDTPSARAVQQAIGQHTWQNRNTEYLQLRIAEVLSDADLWLNTADQFANHDPVIALQLLQRRRQMGDMPVLIQTLHRLTKQFPNTFDNFVLDTLDDKQLTPGVDLNLYLNALENRCRSAGQLSDYLKLREYWTESRRRQFADSLKTPYTSLPLFYAQVLHTEGRSNDLFAWIETLSWQYTRSLPDILPLAAETHPTECMNLVKKHATNLLENGKRDRSLYHTIAGWLAALNTLPSLKASVTLFASQLVANYSRLIALRDELRMQGLVRR